MSGKNDAVNPTPSSDNPSGGDPPAIVDWTGDDDPPPLRPGEDDPPAHVEGDDDPTPAKKDDDPLADDDELEASGLEGDDAPPAWWSDEAKKEWAEKLKDLPEVRKAIKARDEEASRVTTKKLEEAATARKAAEEVAQKARQNDEQNLAWWQTNAEKFTKTFVDRWAGVDWVAFAQKDPAQAQEARFQMERERTMLVEQAQQADEAQKRIATERQGAERQARTTEHEKLSAKYPKAFGKPEIAQKTYNTLSDFLAQKGIPPDRIRTIYELPIVEIVMEAYKYSQLRAKAKEVTTPKPGLQPASKTPTRVVPGAATRAASPADEATRHAEERLRSGERLSPQEAALAFR